MRRLASLALVLALGLGASGCGQAGASVYAATPQNVTGSWQNTSTAGNQQFTRTVTLNANGSYTIAVSTVDLTGRQSATVTAESGRWSLIGGRLNIVPNQGKASLSSSLNGNTFLVGNQLVIGNMAYSR